MRVKIIKMLIIAAAKLLKSVGHTQVIALKEHEKITFKIERF